MRYPYLTNTQVMGSPSPVKALSENEASLVDTDCILETKQRPESVRSCLLRDAKLTAPVVAVDNARWYATIHVQA